jgi:uncharacterized protein
MTRVPLGDGPADIGNGLVSASLASGGAWLSIGAPHPRHGYVELTGLPRFEPAWRGDPEAVRRYRASMADPRFAFLTVEATGPATDPATRALVLDHPATVHELRATHEITARADRDEPCVEQLHRLTGPRAATVVVRFQGRLDAHPLPEITDIDPPPPTVPDTRLVAAGDRLRVEAPALPAVAEVHVSIVGGSSPGWVVTGGTARLVVTATAELRLVVACRLGEPAVRPAPGTRRGFRRLHVPPAKRAALERLAERTRSYILDCTAVRVGPGEICLLTDHRILPLSWTRDAYWQAALLLAARPDRTAVDTVAGHLRWLWARCERPDRFWMRSHHSNGARKDVAFQADQQLYPVLELADFRRLTGSLPPAPAGWWGRQVEQLWDALPVGELGLISSEENAADDEAEYPFPLSAQLLYWLAATRLAELRAELGVERDFAAAAREMAPAIARHFQVDGPFGRQWAYDVDGRGGHRLYHDANDLPTALAPLVGFCAADDPVWAATMRYAFSEHNPGWCAGPFGGLGSRHTPGTWTLGDVQEWVVASLLGELDVAEQALDRLLAVATPDGLLPEAYDPATGANPVRRWFAWPGAALGALLHDGRPR